MRTRVTALVVVPLLVLASACAGSDEDNGSDSPGTSLDGVTITGEVGSAPTVTVKDLSVDKQTNAVISKGDGPDVDTDRESLVHIVLVKGADGSPLISTFTGQAQPQVIGPDSGFNPDLMAAVDAAMDGVPRGSRVAFAAPAEDVVGTAASQLSLAATDTIVGVVDVMSVQPTSPVEGPEGTSVEPPKGAPAVIESGGAVTGFDWTGVGSKPTKVQVIPLVEGTGPEITPGRLVQFDYFGELFKGKEPFDESYSKEPITFPVGANSLIKAWDEGLIGVKEGSRVMIIAPPDAAYGDQEKTGIPANSTLVFVLDVLDVDG